MISEKRKSCDIFVRFRNFADGSLKSPTEFEISSRASSNDADSPWKTNSLSVYSTSFDSVGCSRRSVTEPELRIDISVTHLDKRLKAKNAGFEFVLKIYRKSLTSEDYINIHQASNICETSTNSLKFREIVISQDTILAGASDRFIRFSLRNLNNDELVGDAEILFSQMVNDGKFTLKLYSRDFNGNSLFGVAKRSLHCVGILHINAFLDSSIVCTSSRGSYNSTDSTNIGEDELKEQNVMLASGRTQAYLISLLAPTTEVRLRQHIAYKPSEYLFEPYYYCAKLV